MAIEKKPIKEVIGKMVVTKEGKHLGTTKDITFETRTGEIIQLVLSNPTEFTKTLQLEKKGKEIVIPYNSVIAIGDFIVVNEEDLV